MARYGTLLPIFVLVGCIAQPPPHSITQIPAASKHPCVAATPETLMDIQSIETNGVSICRRDDVGDCFYSAEAGRTFKAGRPDMDRDGHADFLVRDFTGAYGNHEIVHFLGYAACPAGGYVKVLDSFATSMELTDETSALGWRDVSITRDCFDDSTQDVVSRRFRLTWHESVGAYGPPDNDPVLTQHCTMKEMALPPTIPSTGFMGDGCSAPVSATTAHMATKRGSVAIPVELT